MNARASLLRACTAAMACMALATPVLHSQDNVGRTPSVPTWAWRPTIPSANDGQVHILPLRRNVSMLLGAGGNITVYAGDDGVMLVDSGLASTTGQVLAAVRSISTTPIRYIVNTNEHAEFSGGNEAIAAVGETIPFRPAQTIQMQGYVGTKRASVISYLTVFQRMSAPTGQVAPRSEGSWPDNTYATPQKKLYFNSEPVVIMHQPSTTDGNSIVQFRTADVLSVGDLIDMTGYPVIDVKAGGSINAVVDALNHVIQLTVPDRQSEAGTLVIPGKGRVLDQPDVAYYREMMAIVRDRIADMMKRGMTLDQIQAARPTRDWDSRYGRDTGAWTTNMFVEAAYESLKGSR